MSCLCLKIGVTLGSSVTMATREACLLARTLNLVYVKFTANGMDFTCYNTGEAIRFIGEKVEHLNRGEDVWKEGYVDDPKT